MAFSTMKAILGTSLVVLATHGAEVTPLEKVIGLLERLSDKVEQEGKEGAATYDKFACYCKENLDKELVLQAKKTESVAKLDADIKELTTEIAALSGKDGVAGLNQKISKLEKEIKAGQAVRTKEHKEYMVKARDLDEATAACANAIDALENAKTSMDGAKVNLIQVKELQRFVAKQPFITDESLRLLDLFGTGPGDAAAYASQSNNILTLLQDLKRTYIKMKDTLDTDESDAKFKWEKTKQAWNSEKKFSEKDRDEKAQMVEDKNQELSEAKQHKDDDKDDLADSKDFTKSLTLNCEQTAKTFDANSLTRSNELTAISKALTILQDGSAAKTESKRQDMIAGLQKGSKPKLARTLSSPSAASDDHAVAFASKHDQSHDCTANATIRRVPGAGVVPFKPFAKVYKTGFMATSCVKDYMFYHGDKFGDNRLSYKTGTVSNVSIVLYNAHVAREDRKDMSPKVCFDFCRTVPDMNFFGILNGRECYCAPYYQAMASDSTTCDQACEGAPGVMCGSSSKSSMFTMHACANTPAPAPKGATAPSPPPKKTPPKKMPPLVLMDGKQPQATGAFLQMRSIHHHVSERATAIKRAHSFLVQSGHPELNILALKIGLVGDHFVRVRGLIKDLLTKLQKEAKSEAKQKAFCDKGIKKGITDRDSSMSKIERASAKIATLTAAMNSLREDNADLNKQSAALMKELNEATELRNEKMKEAKEGIAIAKQAVADVKKAIQYLNNANKATKLLQTHSTHVSQRSGKTLDVYALKREDKPASRNDGVTGVLEVIASDFDRTAVKLGNIENDEQADFDKLKKSSEAKVGEMKKKMKTNDGDLKDKNSDLLGQQQALKDGKAVLKGAEKQLDSLKSSCTGGMNYKKEAQKRLDEVESLKEAMKILEDMS